MSIRRDHALVVRITQTNAFEPLELYEIRNAIAHHQPAHEEIGVEDVSHKLEALNKVVACERQRRHDMLNIISGRIEQLLENAENPYQVGNLLGQLSRDIQEDNL